MARTNDFKKGSVMEKDYKKINEEYRRVLLHIHDVAVSAYENDESSLANAMFLLGKIAATADLVTDVHSDDDEDEDNEAF